MRLITLYNGHLEQIVAALASEPTAESSCEEDNRPNERWGVKTLKKVGNFPDTVKESVQKTVATEGNDPMQQEIETTRQDTLATEILTEDTGDEN